MNKIISGIFFFLVIALNTNPAECQNSYGWERIYNSIYGITEFYVHQNPDNSKYWMIRPVYNTLGSGNYDFIRYNSNSGSWHIASNSIFRAIYYSYYIGGGNSISGYANPISFAISPSDTNFILIDTFVPHTGSPPYDLRLFYSYDNGGSRSEVEFFRWRSVNGLAINQFNDSICFAARADSIFKSIDRGISWTPVSTIPNFAGSLRMSKFDTSLVYGIDDSLYISTNGGLNFQYAANKKFRNFIFLDSDSSILATVKNKFYRSSDRGFTWSFTDSLADSVITIDSDPDSENIIYAGNAKGLYRSTDTGNSFHLFNNSFSPSRKVIAACKDVNRNYVYVVTEEAVYKCWNSFIIGTEDHFTNVPQSFLLLQNYPNPFNPKTSITYKISKPGNVAVRILDILGKEVVTLINEKKSEGTYTIEFNSKNLSSGIYFYRLEFNDQFADTKRMMLIK